MDTNDGMRRLAALAIMSMLLACSFIPLAPSVKAVGYDYSYTKRPSANNGTYWMVYPRSWSGYRSCPEAKVYGSDTLEIYSTSTITVWAKTDDYNNPDWTDPNETDVVGYLPPADATIMWVWIWAEWLAGYGLAGGRPTTTMYFTVNGGSTWYSSGTFSESKGMGYTISATWEVTDYLDWTPAIINSTDFQVKICMQPTPYRHYYLDYVGIAVYWYVEVEEGEEPPEKETPETIIPEITPNSIIWILGAVGFVGMFAVPPVGIWIAKRNEDQDRIRIFVVLLAAWMFCFTLFLAAG